MKKKIDDFYAGKSIHIHKLITKRPHDVSRFQVEQACIRCHDKIIDGLKTIPDIEIAHYVWNTARTINDNDSDVLVRKVKMLTTVITRLTIKHKRLFKWSVFSYSIAAVCLGAYIYIDCERLGYWIERIYITLMRGQ